MIGSILMIMFLLAYWKYIIIIFILYAIVYSIIQHFRE